MRLLSPHPRGDPPAVRPVPRAGDLARWLFQVWLEA